MVLYYMWRTNKTIINGRTKHVRQKLNKFWVFSFQCNKNLQIHITKYTVCSSTSIFFKIIFCNLLGLLTNIVTSNKTLRNIRKWIHLNCTFTMALLPSAPPPESLLLLFVHAFRYFLWKHSRADCSLEHKP